MPQNNSERSHFQNLSPSWGTSWGTQALHVLVNAALYIFSSGKNQGKYREFHSEFPVGTLLVPVTRIEFRRIKGGGDGWWKDN